MLPGERFKNWIDDLSEAWKDKLRGWMLRWVAEGIAKLFENLEKESLPAAQDFIDKFPLHPSVKADLQTFMSKKSPVAIPAFAMMAIGVVIGSIIGTFMGWAAPIAKWTSYQGEKIVKSFRFDPASWITAKRRKYKEFSEIEGDLRDQGWSEEKIKALEFVTLFIPEAAEQTLWLAREVFEPNMIKKYGLHDEMPKYEDTDFSKIGVSPDQMKNKWAAHWEHASFVQMIEMLHRDLITEDDFREWFKLVEVVPFWREKLIEIVYSWPTRVDVRRWWDMRTISEERLETLYKGMGYRGENLEDYIKWTKVYTDFPVMMARFKKGWISVDEVFDWLIAQGIPEERAGHFIEEKVKPEAVERVAEELSLTKTEIIKGVKQEKITFAEGVGLLQDIGKTAFEADFILSVNVAVLTGSPETYSEFKKLTQLYLQSQGRPAKIPPDDLIQAEKDIKEAEKALTEARAKGIKEDKLLDLTKTVSDTGYRYRQLLLQWEKLNKP